MDDEKIIDLYWARSDSAITETDKKYRNHCMYIARNILNNISDSEECINDTYLAAWNSIPPERPNYLSAFLAKITKNLALKKFRYNTADKRKKEAAVSIEELSSKPNAFLFVFFLLVIYLLFYYLFLQNRILLLNLLRFPLIL